MRKKSKLLNSFVIVGYLLALVILFQNCGNDEGLCSISSEQADYLSANSSSNSQSLFTTLEDTQLVRQVRFYSDPGSRIKYKVTSSPKLGTLISFDESTAEFEYSPQLNVFGKDSFLVTAVVDGGAQSEPKKVEIEITPVNDTPFAWPFSLEFDEDNSKSGKLAGRDIENSTLSYSISENPRKGNVVLNSDGSYTYSPFANENGFDSFSFNIFDGELTSKSVVVSLNIKAVNDVPVVADSNLNTDEDTPVVGQLTAQDPDGDKLTFEIVQSSAKGVIENLSSTGSYIYRPNLNATGEDLFTFKVKDGIGESNTATVRVNLNNVNDAPVARDLEFITNEDTSVNINLAATDPDGDSLTYILLNNQIPFGTVSSFDALKGTLTFVPKKDINGTFSFQFLAQDSSLSSLSKTVTILIKPVNDAPVASDFSIATDMGTQAPVFPVATDADGEALSYFVVTPPINGTVSGKLGEMSFYIPNEGFYGTDTFTYRANDGTADSSIAQVTVTVRPDYLKIFSESIYQKELSQTVDALSTNSIVSLACNGSDILLSGICSAHVININDKVFVGGTADLVKENQFNCIRTKNQLIGKTYIINGQIKCLKKSIGVDEIAKSLVRAKNSRTFDPATSSVGQLGSGASVKGKDVILAGQCSAESDMDPIPVGGQLYTTTAGSLLPQSHSCFSAVYYTTVPFKYNISQLILKNSVTTDSLSNAIYTKKVYQKFLDTGYAPMPATLNNSCDSENDTLLSVSCQSSVIYGGDNVPVNSSMGKNHGTCSGEVYNLHDFYYYNSIVCLRGNAKVAEPPKPNFSGQAIRLKSLAYHETYSVGPKIKSESDGDTYLLQSLPGCVGSFFTQDTGTAEADCPLNIPQMISGSAQAKFYLQREADKFSLSKIETNIERTYNQYFDPKISAFELYFINYPGNPNGTKYQELFSKDISTQKVTATQTKASPNVAPSSFSVTSSDYPGQVSLELTDYESVRVDICAKLLQNQRSTNDLLFKYSQPSLKQANYGFKCGLGL